MAINNIVEINGNETVEEILNKINGNFTQLASLNGGPQGPAGAQGVPGLPGLQGVQGERGVKGDPGTQLQVIDDIEDWPADDELEEGVVYFGDDSDKNVIAKWVDEEGEVHTSTIIANEKIDNTGFLKRIGDVLDRRTVFLKDPAYSGEVRVGISYGESSPNEFGAAFNAIGGSDTDDYSNAAKGSKLFIGTNSLEMVVGSDVKINNEEMKDERKNYSSNIFIAKGQNVGASIGLFGTSIGSKEDIVGILGANEKDASLYVQGSLHAKSDVTVSSASSGNHFGIKTGKVLEKALTFGKKDASTINGLKVIDEAIAQSENKVATVTLESADNAGANYGSSFILNQTSGITGAASTSFVMKRGSDGVLTDYFRTENGEYAKQFSFEDQLSTDGSKRVLNFYGHVDSEKQQQLRFSELKKFTVYTGGWSEDINTKDYNDDDDINIRRPDGESESAFSNVYTNFEVSKDAVTITANYGDFKGTYSFGYNSFIMSAVNSGIEIVNDGNLLTGYAYNDPYDRREVYSSTNKKNFILSRGALKTTNDNFYISAVEKNDYSKIKGEVYVNNTRFSCSTINSVLTNEIAVSDSESQLVLKSKNIIFTKISNKGSLDDNRTDLENGIKMSASPIYKVKDNKFALETKKSGNVLTSFNDFSISSKLDIGIRSNEVLSLIADKLFIQSKLLGGDIVLFYTQSGNDVYEIYFETSADQDAIVKAKKIESFDDAVIYRGDNTEASVDKTDNGRDY